ncbi:hypothetical protein SAMN04488118_1178 [Epibacterium ulvae]|uniref:Uncharacterized protein n=1 Tax=Epibacterium ulvae TaxID=1156985 RepID=A0A1G5RH49_9RHOB|nr:hypothetical protein SAMN04488118_1178 [Epibacterium ulvae]
MSGMRSIFLSSLYESLIYRLRIDEQKGFFSLHRRMILERLPTTNCPALVSASQ